MKRRRERDTPDAYVYRDEHGAAMFACALCLHSEAPHSRDTFTAWRHAAQHLWSVHSRRRVWIDYSSPAQAAAVQTALPIVLAHNTTRHAG